MKFLTWLAIIAFLVFGAGVGVAKAAIAYGTGYYVNLCGGGTAAAQYNCNAGCSPTSGACESGNNGAVKYTCVGKWNQCVESESGWSGREEVGNPGCNRTVQLSLFDKKCRREDGGWDQTCQLLGYMVWYSGECGGPTPQVTQIPQARPT